MSLGLSLGVRISRKKKLGAGGHTAAGGLLVNVPTLIALLCSL